MLGIHSGCRLCCWSVWASLCCGVARCKEDVCDWSSVVAKHDSLGEWDVHIKSLVTPTCRHVKIYWHGCGMGVCVSMCMCTCFYLLCMHQ